MEPIERLDAEQDQPVTDWWTARRAIMVLIVCNVLWAGSYVAGKVALRTLSFVELNGLRFGIAALILLPVLWLERKRLGIARSDLPRLGLLCLLGFVLNKAAEFGGLSLTTASDTAVLIASEGIFTAALGWLILREPIRGRSVGGLALGAAGVYLVVERGLVLPHVGHGAQLVGDLLIVLALLLEGLYTVVGKATLVRYSAFFITAGSIIGSLTVWIPASLIDIAHAGLPRMPLASWGGVVYLAIGATVLAYVGWMLALRYASAGIAAATLYIQPLLGALLAVVLLGEHLLLSTVVGGVCIVMGVWQAGRGAETRQIELTHEETLSI